MLFDSRESMRAELTRMRAAFAERLVLLDHSCNADPQLSIGDHLLWLQRFAQPKSCLNARALQAIQQSRFPAIPDFANCFPNAPYPKAVLNALLAVCRVGFAFVIVEPTRTLSQEHRNDWRGVFALLQPLSDSVFYFDLKSQLAFYPDLA